MNKEILIELTKHFSSTKLQRIFRLLDNGCFESRDEELELDHINFTKGFIIGQFSFSATGEKVLVVTILTSTVISERSSKRLQYEIARKIIKQLRYDALLVAFYDNEGAFRFSFISSIYQGRTRSWSNWHRYTYFVHPNLTNKTFIQQISRCDFSNIKSIENAFSIEAVNGEFFKGIAKLYDELVGTNEKPATIGYPELGDERQQFAVRLIGRIVFCWFLREKKSVDGIPLISKTILSRHSAAIENYYHFTIAPLFFEVLNKPISKRPERFQLGEFGKIPYLNGGLFAPQNDDHYKYDDTLECSVSDLVNIPDDWLQRLFDLLEMYHFTVDENTSVDIDLSIDPEMLGRIFENLLARINPETGETVRKATGSFYTPREIVEYMVDESLVQYLKETTDVKEEILRALVSYDLIDNKELFDKEGHNQQIVKSLSTIKVLDPACGSGAFPIGNLQKIVFILQQIDPEAKLWFEHQIAGTIPEVRHLIEREFENKNFDYIRKLGIIRESIFGIDIQPIATEIARLRCFLTLIVDERVNDNEYNRGVYPLPNLDFKFVTANTLIPVPEQNIFTGETQQDLFDSNQQEKIEKLKLLRNEYFNAQNSDRAEIKAEFRLTQNELWIAMHNSSSYGQQSLVLSGWDPFSIKSTDWFDPEWMFGINSFDIVIGNPPYIQLQKNEGELADIYKDIGYVTFTRTGDIYSLFYERGLSIAKKNTGLLCFITSNKWLKASYGEKTRKYFAQKNPLKLLNFTGFKIFDSATVETSILLIQNKPNGNELKAVKFIKDYKKGDSIYEYFKKHGVNLENNEDESWYIGSAPEISLRNKINLLGTPIKQWGVKINFGVKTGYNKAFIINNEQKVKLISEDPKNAELIKPVIRGRDIERFVCNNELYLIFIPWHFPLSKSENSKNFSRNEEKFRKLYPAIYNHLLHHKKKLLSRNKAEIGIRYEWYALQRCANTYLSELEKDKLIWKRIGSIIRFSYDNKRSYPLDSTCILTGKNIKLILAVLNSKLGNYLLQDSPRTGTGDLILSVQAIDPIRIPLPNKNNDNLVSSIEQHVTKIIDHYSKKIDDELNTMIYKLYRLTPQEIQIIENLTPIN